MTLDTERAAKLIRMLSSDHEGEVIAAARKLCQMDIHEIAKRMEDAPHDGRAIDSEFMLEVAQRRISELRAEIRSLKKQLKVGKVQCVVCDGEFLARRSDAKTCSAKCRKHLQRHG